MYTSTRESYLYYAGFNATCEMFDALGRKDNFNNHNTYNYSSGRSHLSRDKKSYGQRDVYSRETTIPSADISSEIDSYLEAFRNDNLPRRDKYPGESTENVTSKSYTRSYHKRDTTNTYSFHSKESDKLKSPFGKLDGDVYNSDAYLSPGNLRPQPRHVSRTLSRDRYGAQYGDTLPIRSNSTDSFTRKLNSFLDNDIRDDLTRPTTARTPYSGIVGMDKTQMSSLEEENNKLRQKLSEFQHDNIKLKEDFNELKMYNDKAQTTVKDLKACLEDARKERKQLSEEIKKIRDQGNKHTVSNIINHYMEKGLYEEPEKSDRQRSRSRPISPTRSRSVSPRRYRARSESPVLSHTVTPVRSNSPVDKKVSGYTTTGYTARAHTPVDQSYNYEDISPTVSDGHEIYPHRRTRSYVQKFGQTDGRDSPVDLSDPELQELMKPTSKLNYDVDLNDNTQYGLKKDRPESFKIEDNTAGLSAKRRLMYSPYAGKDGMTSKFTHAYDKDNIKPEIKTQTYNKPASQQSPVLNEELENRKFIQALDTAVKETPAQLAQQRYISDLNDTDDWQQRTARSILKTNKSAQNISIKENMPLRRSYESRSYSPSLRTPVSRSYSPATMATQSSAPTRPYIAARSYTPTETKTTQNAPARTQPRSHSPGNAGSRSYSPEHRMSSDRPVGRSHSPGQRYRSGNPSNGVRRDSGYSTPTKPVHRNTDHNHQTTAPSPMPRITPRLTKLDSCSRCRWGRVSRTGVF